MSDDENKQPSPDRESQRQQSGESNVIRVGFLGASSIAHKVWRAVEAAGSMRVTAVGARDPAKAQQFIRECTDGRSVPQDRAPIATTYDELVTSSDVDVIYISIPVTMRDPWVRKCIENGKHVVGEKPPAVNGEQLQEWLEDLAAHKLLYMDGTMFSHGPYIEGVVKALPSIGAVRHLTSNFTFYGDDNFRKVDIRCDPSLEPLGCLGDMGWYCVRAFLHAMNFAMPVAVAGRVLERNEKGAIMAFSGDLTFTDPQNAEGIVTGQFYCSFVSADEDLLIISGTDGTINAPQIILPVTDKPSAFQVTKGAMFGEGTALRVMQETETIPVLRETGHTQETEMWRDVRDCLHRDENGKLVASQAETQKWGRRAWITQCILDKLNESASAQAAATSS